MGTMDIVVFMTATVGAVTGIGGLVLGILNYRHRISEAPTRLRVLPKLAFPGPLDEMVPVSHCSPEVEQALKSLKTYMCVEVTNLSATAKTIFEIGLVADDGKEMPWREMDLEWMEPSRKFPLVLAPNETGAAYIRILLDDDQSLYPIGYARTDCGERFTGRSPVVNDLLSRALTEVSEQSQ